MLGIEIKSEWVRRFWLNKNVTNNQIEKTISDIHDIGATCGATIILGLPGLSDKQSVELLIETVNWLDKLSVSYIQIVYLVNRKNTVQEFIIKS